MAYHGRRNSTQPTPRGIMGFPETIALPAHWLKKLSVNLLHKFGRGKPGDENVQDGGQSGFPDVHSKKVLFFNAEVSVFSRSSG